MATDFLLFDEALSEYKKISDKNIVTNKKSFDEDDDSYNSDNDINTVDEENLSHYSSDDENNKDEIKDDMEETRKCLHKNVLNENGVNICYDCGVEIDKTIFQDKEWRYYGTSDNKRTSDPNRVHIRKVEDRSIFKDVENMKFSDKIVALANQIYIQVTKGQIYRGNSRKSIIFACVFHSLKLSGKPESHETLMKIFDLNKKTGLKGLKIVNLNAPKDSIIHTTYITPANIIEDIMNKFEATNEQKTEVLNLYNKIKNKSSKINRSRPGSIASGLVYFWISLKNINVSLKDFAKKVELSELTIMKISKEISEILGVIPECWL
jgi:transcription initiation factor TFIIIB Brf1 subunit/transcription initiation factor TFIIB